MHLVIFMGVRSSCSSEMMILNYALALGEEQGIVSVVSASPKTDVDSLSISPDALIQLITKVCLQNPEFLE